MTFKTLEYVEALMQAIISKEVSIKYKYEKAMKCIENELLQILLLDRMDSSLYSETFQISNIGKSIQTKLRKAGYYKLILRLLIRTIIKKLEYSN